MGVAYVTRKVATRAGDESRDGNSFQVTRGVTYQAVIDDYSTTDAQILADPRIPVPRAPHPDNLYLRAVRRSARRVSPILVEVDIEYEIPGGGGNPQDLTKSSPLDKPPQISFDSIASEVEIDEDVNGDPIIMVTTEEFRPRPRVTTYDPIIRVARNVTWIDPVVIAQYRNSVNSDTWYGLPAGTVRITNIRADSVSDDDFSYWQVSAEFHIRRAPPGSTDARAWYARIRAQGYLVNIPAALSFTDDDLIAVRATKNGQPVSEPVLHEVETGYQITDNANAEWYEFEVYRPMPFASLGLI